MELKNYLQILDRRKWVITIVVLVTMAVVVIGTLKMTPYYTATATLRIATASSSTSSSDYMYADRLITTYLNIATSRPVADELKKQLNFTKDPKIDVKQIPSSELIQISVEDQDPSLAMQAANTLGAILISQSGEFYTGTGKTPADVLQDQVTQAEADLNQLRTNYYNRIAEYPDDAAGNQAAAKAVDSQQQLYFSLLSQYQQLKVKEALQSNLISFVEQADLPISPSKPNKVLNFALGFLLSVIAGIGLAFLFENLDTTINTSEVLVKTTHLRPIGWIPIERKGYLQKVPLIGNSLYSEAFYRLRTNLLMLITDPPIRTLMVASAMQGEGKSTVACSLAYALAQSGKKVLLIDCDLRVPTIHKTFSLVTKIGICDYLENNANPDEIIQETAYTNLSVIDGAESCKEPGLLLDPSKMKSLFEHLQTNYDLVILDTPAVQAVTDASVLVPLVDGVLMVTKLGLIRKEILESTLDQLANVKANIVGLVINGSKTTNHYYYYRRRIVFARGEQPNGAKH